MSVPIVHEDDVEELALPGRHLRWLVTAERLNAQHMSVCVIRVAPGETVRPAHSHPNGEETIYIIRGTGRVLVSGEVATVTEGSTVLFPQGAVHMLQNTGKEEMKVVCFFAPASDLSSYKFFETVEFPAPAQEK
jgi:quercetin dioxygenase-like cupin family protein